MLHGVQCNCSILVQWHISSLTKQYKNSIAHFRPFLSVHSFVRCSQHAKESCYTIKNGDMWRKSSGNKCSGRVRLSPHSKRGLVCMLWPPTVQRYAIQSNWTKLPQGVYACESFFFCDGSLSRVFLCLSWTDTSTSMTLVKDKWFRQRLGGLDFQ